MDENNTEIEKIEASVNSKVFIVNFAGHNYSEASAWGELVALTDGYVSLKRPDRILFELTKKLSNSTPNDWICPSGLMVLNIIACLIFYEMHGTVRLLNWRNASKKQPNVPAYQEIIFNKGQLNLLLSHFNNAA